MPIDMDLHRFLKKWLTQSSVVQAKDKLVLAVSGGVDSMVLLDLFDRLRASLDLRLFVAHVDHGVRGRASALDARFVAMESKRRGIPFDGKKMPKGFFKGKGNFQEVARELRYQFFEKVATKHKAKKILTAHQADDGFETFLMRLIRGAGIEGLKGITLERSVSKEKKNIRLIRPLLFFSRDQIIQYAQERKVPWREDSSNQKEHYLRNRVRKRIVKEMKQLNPRVVENMAATLDSLQKEERWIENKIEKDLNARLLNKKGEVQLPRKWLESLEEPARYRVYRRLMREAGVGLEGIGRVHLETLDSMIREKNNKARLTLPRGFGAYLTEKQLVLKKWAKEKHREKSGFFY